MSPAKGMARPLKGRTSSLPPRALLHTHQAPPSVPTPPTASPPRGPIGVCCCCCCCCGSACRPRLPPVPAGHACPPTPATHACLPRSGSRPSCPPPLPLHRSLRMTSGSGSASARTSSRCASARRRSCSSHASWPAAAARARPAAPGAAPWAAPHSTKRWRRTWRPRKCRCMARWVRARRRWAVVRSSRVVPKRWVQGLPGPHLEGGGMLSVVLRRCANHRCVASRCTR